MVLSDLVPLLHGGTLSCLMSGLFCRHSQLPATSLPFSTRTDSRDFWFLNSSCFMRAPACMCVCVWL
jgi:hypothetical protein